METNASGGQQPLVAPVAVGGPAAEIADLKPLARQIQRGKCILFLGPGAATVPGVLPERPLTTLLSERLAQDPRLTEVAGLLDTRDLRHVSQMLYNKTHELASIQEKAVDFYTPLAGQTGEFHDNIAALPFTFCLTTTPDDFLYTALEKVGKRPSRHFYNFRNGRASRPSGPPSVDRPLVYHLYGYVDEPDSLVITENDLIDFLASVVRNAPALSDIVRAELARPETNCLFVDLGFKNWYLRALLRALAVLGHNDSSVALEGAEFFEQSRHHQTTVYFSVSQAISFRKDSLTEFSRQLRAAYDSISVKKTKTEPLPSGAPMVFLSYVREDRAAAELLAENLMKGGVAVWQDVQSLRVGDRWEQALEDVIGKQANYFLVFQTPALVNRIETYVGREINQALERNSRILHGFKFILPVTQGARAPLRQLAPFQAIDLEKPNGVEQLISEIHKDWNERAAVSTAAREG